MKFSHRSLLQVAGFTLSALVILMTAGCFRPASEAPESEVLVTDTPAQSTPLPLTTDDPNAQTVPTINVEIVTPQVTNTPNAPQPLPTITQQPFTMPTLTPSLSADQMAQPTIDSSGSNFAMEGSPTILFITPGSPLGFVTPDPVTPSATLSLVELSTRAAATARATAGGDAPDVEPTTTPMETCIYVVQPGDTLYQISIDQDIALSEIRAVNPELEGDNPILQIEQEIRMPREGCEGYVPPTATERGESTAESSAPEGSGEVYIVQAGDTLYAIALRFGTTVSAIVRANNLTNADSLRIGQELIIPAGD